MGTLRAMAAVNLGLRFLLELGGVAALAYWGWRTGDTLPFRLVLAIGVPLALVIAWTLIVAPGADNPLPQTARMLVGTALLLVAAGALVAAGQPQLAVIFALLIVVNQVLLLVPGGTEA
jgi:hypothetical protein